MLQGKYLPQYHFSEKHSIVVRCQPRQIFSLVDQFDFSESKIIRFLFFLRGLPASMMNKEGLSRGRFTELEKIENAEIIIGLIGQFWKPSGNLQVFTRDEFIPFSRPGFLKATWNFELIPLSAGNTLLETETRIHCADQQAYKKFSRYWFIIRPFSGMIRKEILKSIRVKAERNAKHMNH